jgi:polyhydroxybutyrate depolymerase
MKNKVVRILARIGLVASGFVTVLLLLYAFIYFASIVGRETILVGKMERTYRVHLPSGYDGTQPAPLMLAFHFYTGSGRSMEWLTHLNQIADREGFMVVYPDGYEGSWAEGSNLYAADLDQVDDLAFVSALLDQLEQDYAVDPTRVYATGFSSGGIFVHRLACEMPERFAGIATVGAVLTRNVIAACQPESPAAVMMINGSDDRGVPWEGNTDYASVPETVAHWARVSACGTEASQTMEPEAVDDGTQVERSTYSPCQDGAQVTLYRIAGGGHTWPGGSQPVQLWGLNGKISQEMDASLVTWEFFRSHHR